MSQSWSSSETTTFTATHAKHIAAKVHTDLKRMQRFYGGPTDEAIERYEVELIEFLKAGYLGTITYGFRRDDQWIEPTIRYAARDLMGNEGQDDDPGRIRAGANIQDATFHSYLTYSPAWDRLLDAARESFNQRLPFQRVGAPEPGVDGQMTRDHVYSSGGRALDRSTLRRSGQ